MTSFMKDEAFRPSAFYSRRTNDLIADIDGGMSRLSSYSVGLATLGLVVCVALYQSLVSKALPLWMPILVAAPAVFVLQRRHVCKLGLIRLWSLAEYYKKGEARLNRKWEALDAGENFLDQDHFYSADLDLFGQKSLYQLLCSARTQLGRETLAKWMMAPASVLEIRDRQAAISELRERRDLPEALATAGPMQVSDCRPEFLSTWATESSPSFPSWG
jgi:hypothetical protein